MDTRTQPLQTNPSNASYRYGFGGQESDFEVNNKGGTSYTAEFWQYDSRLGRRWNVDPVDQVSISNYACFRNNPVLYKDPLGAEVDFGKGKKERRQNMGNFLNGRLFGDKQTRQKYKGMYRDENVVYHMQYDENKPSIWTGGELQGVDATNVMFRYSMEQSEPEEVEPEPIEWEKKTFGGQKLEEIPFHKKYNAGHQGRDPVEINQSVILRRRVPGEPITLEAEAQPDSFTLHNRSTGISQEPIFLGGENFVGTINHQLIIANPTDGLIIVRIHSHNINTLNPRGQSHTLTTDGTVSYTKYTGLHFTIRYPKLFKK